MDREQVWKNFQLGQELNVSGAFIYNGLYRFHEMSILDYTEDVFEFLYNLSVGFERLLKVAVVLLEHDGSQDQNSYEQSLLTHNHLELLKRVKKHVTVRLSGPHFEFLGILGTFYKTLRYDRFTLSPQWDPNKEKNALRGFLEKHLKISLPESDPFATRNEPRFLRHIGQIVGKISHEIYRIVKKRAHELNLYTYELRSGSKAEKVFLGKCDFADEDVLLKELLIFFMNTKLTGGIIDFMRSIEPLDFDVGMAQEYLLCFISKETIAEVMPELEALYEGVDDQGKRLEMLGLVGNTGVPFDINDDDE